jgi:cytoskeletal protein RodZ
MQGSPVQGLGEMLREARERKGVTLTEAQQATKIRYAFLQALENEDFSALPPKVYVRGFIKNYAAFLSLDATSAVQQYDSLQEMVYAPPAADGQPSADSGGQFIPVAYKGETRSLQGAPDRFQVSYLPAPGQTSADTDATQTRAIVPVSRYSQPLASNIHLPSVMLKDTRGPFYIPNFTPAILVAIIMIAALLLVYQGINSQKEAVTEEGNLPVATTNTSSSRVTAITTTNTITGTSTTGSKAAISPTARIVLTPPPFQNTTAPAPAPANTQAQAPATTDNQPGTNPVGQGGAAVATPPEPPPPPSPTAIPQPIKVDVIVTTADAKGSWISVWVDGEQKIARVVAAGDTISFTGNKTVAVRSGNPGVVRVQVNGQDREYWKTGMGVITRTYFADGKPDTIE